VRRSARDGGGAGKLVPTPLGSHSPRLAGVRALLHKKGRSEQRRFAIEGLTLLQEALQAGRRPEAVYVTAAGLATLGALANGFADRLFIVAPGPMERLSDLETAPGIVAVYPEELDELGELLSDGNPGLVLGVADPGNAGTLMRSADIFGLRNVIFDESAIEPYNPKLVRATMGALFRVGLAISTVESLVVQARRHSYAVVVADRSGSPLSGFTFARKSLIVIGHERRGAQGWLEQADDAVAIPQEGHGQSLNAAVAGSIVMYAFSQQFGSASPGS